ITANVANTFQPSGGEFECQTTNNSHGTLQMHATNYFHNLKINPATGLGGGIAYSDLHIDNDLIVSAGTMVFDEYTVTVDRDAIIYGGLNMDEPDGELVVGDDIFWKSGSNATWVTDGEIHVNDDWTFENGTEAQLGPGNIVRFIGSGTTSIYNYDADASFGSMTTYKSAGTDTYLNGASTYPIHCTGGLSVESNNNLHIQHEALVVDGGVFIGFNSLLDMLSNGSLEDGNDLDLYGTLNVGGGEAAVNGDFTLYSTGTLTITDGSFICNDAYDASNKEIRGNLNLTGNGIFEITNNSVQIYSTANCNITNGVFRVGAHFFATQAGTFQPSGGVFDMSAGYSGGMIYCSNGNYFYDLEINDHTSAETDLTIDHDLDIVSGTFNVTDQTVDVGHDVNIFGTLKITHLAGVLECENRVYWKPGSYDNITVGNIYAKFWTWEDGTNAQLGTGNTAHIQSGIGSYDPDAEFGNLIIGDWSKSMANKNYIKTNKPDIKKIFEDGSIRSSDDEGSAQKIQKDGKTNYPRRVAGFCTYLPGAGWSTSVDIIVQGTLDIMDGASQTLTSTNTISTYSYFLLNGGLDLGDQGNGHAYAGFDLNNTGELTIAGGEFTVEGNEPNIYGALNLSDGIFDTDQQLGILSFLLNVTGGTIRVGGHLNISTGSGSFTPSGGTVEFYGNEPSMIIMSNTDFLHHLLINKTNEDVDAIFFLDATVQGQTTVEEGILEIDNDKQVNFYGDVDVNDGGTFVLNHNSIASFNDLTHFNINSGGAFQSSGSYTNEPAVKSLSGYYYFDVKSGGTVSAYFTFFENMRTNGLNIHEGAIIDTENPFNRCDFKNGSPGSTLITIDNDQELTIDFADFFTNGSENYNVTKNVNTGNITFSNFGGDFYGPAHEKDLYGRIHWYVPELSVSPAVQNVSAEAGTTTFNVTANVDWTVTESVDWFTVAPMSGSNNGTLTVTYEENTALTPRSGTITISGDDVTDVVVTVNQAGADPELAVAPSNRSVSASEGTTSFSVTSNTNGTLTVMAP
ncbi:MAG: hypothetical protein B6I19_07590, partial [Bacteroidetes bacterium 4572_114]